MSYPITFEHAVKKYGDNIIIPDLSLEIHDGEFLRCWGLRDVEKQRYCVW